MPGSLDLPRDKFSPALQRLVLSFGAEAGPAEAESDTRRLSALRSFGPDHVGASG